MHKVPASEVEVDCHVPLHVIEDSQHLTEMVRAVDALLRNPHRPEPVSAARIAIREAIAIADRVASHLAVVGSFQGQRQRAEQAHRAEAARVAAAVRT